ncbi:unnamed protein product [Linum tenue]|uniref:Endosulphine n=1 Tax=Linum tenue TaxID=586396 RepID=A0AAV0IWV6_9ROSI|nr:unnamed protein product [Linum tenue]
MNGWAVSLSCHVSSASSVFSFFSPSLRESQADRPPSKNKDRSSLPLPVSNTFVSGESHNPSESSDKEMMEHEGAQLDQHAENKGLDESGDHKVSDGNADNNPSPSPEQEEQIIRSKYGGILPKKKPLISKDHERAFFDSADWALGKQGAQKPKGPLEALRPKLQPNRQQQSRARRSAYARGEGGMAPDDQTYPTDDEPGQSNESATAEEQSEQSQVQ